MERGALRIYLGVGPRVGKVPRRREVMAWALCVVGLPLLTALLVSLHRHLNLSSALLLNLALVLVIAAVGGVRPGVFASVAASLLTNWYLTPPKHTLNVTDTDNIVALGVFVSMALGLSTVVVMSEANVVRRALLQAVSHDLRTPLASIKASVTGLMAADVGFSVEDRRDLLATIDTSADRLDRLIGNLLDMSRLQSGVTTAKLAPTAMEEVVAAALGGLAISTGRVVVEVSERLPLVLTDSALLERSVANLVSNALAWSEDDVRIEADEVSNQVELRVIDHGPGIPENLRARMFEPFQRLGDRSNDAGAGLGLAIARGFVELTGGKIALTDTPGGGCTFTIIVPTARQSS